MSFNDNVGRFRHFRLAELESYPAFREALAALVDESDAPLSQFLDDLRGCAISSPFGSPCPACGVTRWPISGQRRHQSNFTGLYRCACGEQWRSDHDIRLVNWRDGDTSGNVPTQQNRKPTS